METLVIVETVYPEGTEYKKRKGEIVDWSEVMRRFNLTGEELKDVIEKGIVVSNNNVEHYLDYALSW